MTTPMAQVTGTVLFSEREWDKLLNMILEGCIIPVIGPELLRPEQNSRTEFLYDTWGLALAEQAGLQIQEPTEMFGIQALGTAAHYCIPVLLAILNNASYRILKCNPDAYRKTVQEPVGPPYPSRDLDHPVANFAEISEGFRGTESNQGSEVLDTTFHYLKENNLHCVIDAQLDNSL